MLRHNIVRTQLLYFGVPGSFAPEYDKFVVNKAGKGQSHRKGRQVLSQATLISSQHTSLYRDLQNLSMS